MAPVTSEPGVKCYIEILDRESDSELESEYWISLSSFREAARHITPEIEIAGVTLSEGDPGATPEAVFTVTLSEASNHQVTVGYQTVAGSAGADLDYASIGGSLVFAPGETSRTLAVPVLGDLLDEPDEEGLVALADATGAVLTGEPATAIILDDDPPPQVSIGGAGVLEGHEGATDMVFTVALSAASGFDVTVDYLTVDDSATAGLDYQARAGTVLIPAGALTAAIAVPVLGDLLDEPDEAFTVQLTGAVHGVLAAPLATGTIADDDDPPVLSITGATVTEAPGAQLAFTVALSAASGFEVTADYQTAGGTASVGLDYAAVAGSVSLAAGMTSATVVVPILDDAFDEDDEMVLLSLSDPVNAQPPAVPVAGTIVDDDPLPALSIDDVTVVEGDPGGTATAAFTVSLSAVSGRQVTVEYATANGDAEAGEDFAAAAGTVVFAPGETIMPVQIDVLANDYQESEEAFSVLLASPVHAVVADAEGVAIIVDDDLPALAASKTDLLLVDEAVAGEANPGDVLRYEIILENLGTGIATEVVLEDPLPLDVTLVEGSVSLSAGTITSEDPLQVTVGELAVGESVNVGFDVQVANPLPGEREISNQAIVASAELPDLLTDDPDQPGAADPTVTPVVGCDYGLEVAFAEGCGTVFIPATCGQCDGKVTELTLEYLGEEADAHVEVVQKHGSIVVFDGIVQPGEHFSFAGADGHGTLSSEITIYVNGVLNARMHTSCSKPIGPGMVRGDFLVVEGTSRHGGPLCPLPAGGLCGDCDGKVSRLTLEYLGEEMDAYVEVVQKKDSVVVFAGTVQPGELFSFAGADNKGTLSTEITIYIDG
ncbi:MAG: DUF11 domain-containing protein, partial [Actinomycetia bacterium]|nr:DUF11 domain-containing protein [Actinomycetes bacterium]